MKSGIPLSPEWSPVILSSLIFVLSSRWAVRKIHQDAEDRSKSGRSKYTSDNNFSQEEMAKISPRGQRCLGNNTSYLKYFLRSLSSMCHPTDNPTGHIALCMAENKLVLDVLGERLMQFGTTTAAFSNSAVFCYNSFLGIPICRQSAAYFLAKRFLFPDKPSITPEEALQHIDPSSVAVTSGAVSALNSLFFLLGQEGDACLIPAPYYAAFDSDMNLVAGIVPYAVHCSNPILGPTESEFDLAYMQAKSQGLNPRFILFTNPHNPLGVIYKKEVVQSTVNWARKRGLQTIVDELYALSTHKRDGHGFQSIIRVLDNKLGDDVHMIWALSKDFGASGLRVGYLYSQNKILIEGCLANMNVFSGVSNPVQMVVAELLTDDQWVDSYLDISRQRLLASYEICVSKLEEMVMPFVPAQAGMFVYVDFSSLLPKKTFEWEKKLSDLIMEHARIVLTPGESQRDRHPGMFRICYSWVSPEVLEIGMERLSRLVAKIRRMDWSDLNEVTLSGIL